MGSTSKTVAVALAMVGIASSSSAEKAYGPGVTDAEIKIGNTYPYSGPASAYGLVGKTEAAYMQMINDQGGVNGRKINLISYDDAYSPPKTVEQTRKLVESDNVLFIFAPLGTPTNSAIHKYVNQKQIPHLFLASGAAKFNDPKNFPWTMGWQPSLQTEGRIYAQYILKNKPDAKIAILSQNDDYGRDHVRGFLEGLGDKVKPVLSLTYEVADPTIDSQMARLQASGADTFFNVTTPKFAAMAIKKAAEANWKPLHILPSSSASVGVVLKPAGLDNSQGIISGQYAKDPTDPQWKDDPGFKRYTAFLDKYMPGANKADSVLVAGYSYSQTLIELLKKCGDDLTRENVMKQAASFKNVELDMLLPGITVTTSPDDFGPVQQLQLMAFKGDHWVLFGEVFNARTKRD